MIEPKPGNGTPLVNQTPNIIKNVITATNDLGSADTATLNLAVNKAPVVVNDVISLTGYLSVFYAAQPTFSGFPLMTYAVTGGALPNGLMLNSSTGAISGTPTQAGNFTFKIRATNVVGGIDSRSYTLQINGAPVYSSSTISETTPFGSAYSGSVLFSSYVDSYEIVSCGCAVSGSNYDQLPPGISFDTATGLFSGSSSAVGTYKFKVRAFSMNHSVYGDSALLTIEVRSAPVWIDRSFANNVMIGSAYSDGVQVLSYPVATYTKTGLLPTGMSFDSTTGLVSGTPTVTGDFPFSVTATNAVGSISKNLTLRVYQSP
jgi:hypothetical protein